MAWIVGRSPFFFFEPRAREGGAAAARFADRLRGEGRATAVMRRPQLLPMGGRAAATMRIAFD